MYVLQTNPDLEYIHRVGWLHLTALMPPLSGGLIPVPVCVIRGDWLGTINAGSPMFG